MYLQTDYLNLDINSNSGKNNERENIVQTKCTFCGGANYSAEKGFKRIRKNKKNLVRMVIQTNNELNVHLANALDADFYIN